MQEEVTDRTVQVTITTTKLTARVLKDALMKILQHLKNRKLKTPVYRGRQTVKQLVGQNKGVSNIEVTDQNIKSFDKVARKYGVDYAVKKDRSVHPPKYLIFFKAQDADALTAAFTEYTAKTVKQKPSVLALLGKLKALVKEKSIPERNHSKGDIEH